MQVSINSDVIKLETIEDIPVARFTPSAVLFERCVPLITDLVRQFAAQNVPHLIVDARLVGFAPPSLVERLGMVREWAEAAHGRVRIAMLTKSEYIDPERFGIVAAGNFGLSAQVFDVEPEAIDWLRAERTADICRGADYRPTR